MEQLSKQRGRSENFFFFGKDLESCMHNEKEFCSLLLRNEKLSWQKQGHFYRPDFESSGSFL